MDRWDTVQAQQWLGIPVQRLLGEHIQTLINQLLIEKAASFDIAPQVANLISNNVMEFLMISEEDFQLEIEIYRDVMAFHDFGQPLSFIM